MFHKLIVSPILPRKSDPASLLARVRALAESSKIEVTSISCSLKDNSFGKVSGCRRILKQFPQLFSTSLGAATAASEAAELGVISNMTEPWEYAFSDEVRPRFSMDLLCEIAEGIPRRWPVGSAVIVLDLARWPGFDVPPDDFRPKLRGPIEWDRLTEYWKPSIVASTIRDPWGRRDELHAIIPLLPPPEPGESELRLNDQLRDCLRTLGSSAKIQVQITRSPEEEEAMIQERSDLYGLIEEHCTNLQDILLPVMTPVEWTSEERDQLYGALPSVKPSLLRAIQGTGFKYDSSRSGQGGYTFAKELPSGFRFSGVLDVGPNSRRLSASSTLEGADFELHLPVPVATFHKNGDDEEVDPPERLEQLLANVMRVLAHHETTLIPKLESRMTPPAKWEQKLRKVKKFLP